MSILLHYITNSIKHDIHNCCKFLVENSFHTRFGHEYDDISANNKEVLFH